MTIPKCTGVQNCPYGAPHPTIRTSHMCTWNSLVMLLYCSFSYKRVDIKPLLYKNNSVAIFCHCPLTSYTQFLLLSSLWWLILILHFNIQIYLYVYFQHLIGIRIGFYGSIIHTTILIVFLQRYHIIPFSVIAIEHQNMKGKNWLKKYYINGGK